MCVCTPLFLLEGFQPHFFPMFVVAKCTVYVCVNHLSLYEAERDTEGRKEMFLKITVLGEWF